MISVHNSFLDELQLYFEEKLDRTKDEQVLFEQLQLYNDLVTRHPDPVRAPRSMFPARTMRGGPSGMASIAPVPYPDPDDLGQIRRIAEAAAIAEYEQRAAEQIRQVQQRYQMGGSNN